MPQPTTRLHALAAVLSLALIGCSSRSGTAPTPSTGGTPATPSMPATPSTISTAGTSGPASSTDTLGTTPSAPSAPLPAGATSTTVADGSPAAAADELVAAERAIRDPNVVGDALDTWGARQQRAYQALARHPDWIAAVTAQLPADVAAAAAFNLRARQAVADHAAAVASSLAAASVTTAPPSATLPAWSIVAPLPIDVLLADYHDGEQRTGVPWQYLAAIHLVETRMGRIVGTSPAGAVGPMQFLPATWKRCCTGNVLDAHDAIVGAATFLATHGAPADMTKAIHAYNPNDGYVGAVMAYAAAITADPMAYRGYHGWEVYVSSSAGTVRLPIGYAATAPIDATAYLATHPADRAG